MFREASFGPTNRESVVRRSKSMKSKAHRDMLKLDLIRSLWNRRRRPVRLLYLYLLLSSTKELRRAVTTTIVALDLSLETTVKNILLNAERSTVEALKCKQHLCYKLHLYKSIQRS